MVLTGNAQLAVFVGGQQVELQPFDISILKQCVKKGDLLKTQKERKQKKTLKCPKRTNPSHALSSSFSPIPSPNALSSSPPLPPFLFFSFHPFPTFSLAACPISQYFLLFHPQQ